MARHVGGTKVESGYYVNTRSFAVVTLPVDGPLPGGEGDRFVRVPWPLLMLVAPVVGGAFVIAYPIFGFSMMVLGLAKKVAGVAGQGAEELAATLAPGHAVGEAHLTGKRGEAPKPGEGPAPRDPEVEDLEKEIRERREGK
jgi:hypothetical protein